MECEYAAELSKYMLAEEKALRLGKFIIDLQKYNEELQDRVVPRTPPEQGIKWKGAIEDTTTENMELEKAAQKIA